MSDNTSGVEFVGCDLHYHSEKPVFEKNPSTLNCLGHASPNITLQVYAHLMPNADEEMMAGFNDEHLKYKSMTD